MKEIDRSTHYRERLVNNFSHEIDQLLEHFFNVMPNAYFEAHDDNTILQHLSALVASKASDHSSQIALQSESGDIHTFIHTHSYPGLLSQILSSIPVKKTLHSAKVYTALDNSLVIDIFDTRRCGSETRTDIAFSPQQLQTLKEQLSQHLAEETITRSFDKFIHQTHQHYIHTFPAHLIAQHIDLVDQVKGSLDVAVQLTQTENSQHMYLSYAAGQTNSTHLLKRLAHYLGHIGCNILEAYLENLFTNSTDKTALVVLKLDNASAFIHGEKKNILLQDLRRLPYISRSALHIYQQCSEYTLVDAEVLSGLCHLAHQNVAFHKTRQLSREQVISAATKHERIAFAITQAFCTKFSLNPTSENIDSLNIKQISQQLPEITDLIKQTIVDDNERFIFNTLIELVKSTIKSNVHLPQRYALSFRLTSMLWKTEQRPEQVFGIFFVTGKSFDGFHVRFQDIARGGVRIVRPHNLENYALDTQTLFDEVYDLSYAQQLKNKDIPEGGSKAVVLIEPTANKERCGRAFVDGLLDLIIPNTLLPHPRYDYDATPEFIYLGPDENVSNDMINWVTEQATKRGYALPTAFMSSKPSAGINHKIYGVTSEGVTVYLDEGLKALGITPKTMDFTVKITGGPDGDVAGNEIKILHREYGDHAKIVGIADGSGCAEDPEGLCHQELLRLVENSLPIAHFSLAALSPQGRVLPLDVEGAIVARNSLHNRLQTDAFIPAGGRPATINNNNWHKFLNTDNKASTKLIVEGANLFITQEARTALAEHGVLIIKDSSANKCGVICSSYEIIASMLLSEEEFLSIKPQFIQEVLEKLQSFALLEAKSLFNAYRHQPQIPLTELSLLLSQEILITTQCIAELFADKELPLEQYIQSIFEEFIPTSLLAIAQSRIQDSIPLAYIKRAVASLLASRIIYHEGIDYLRFMSEHNKKQHIIRYLDQEEKTKTLINKLQDSSFEEKDMLIRLLNHSGSSTALKW